MCHTIAGISNPSGMKGCLTEPYVGCLGHQAGVVLHTDKFVSCCHMGQGLKPEVMEKAQWRATGLKRKAMHPQGFTVPAAAGRSLVSKVSPQRGKWQIHPILLLTWANSPAWAPPKTAECTRYSQHRCRPRLCCETCWNRGAWSSQNCHSFGVSCCPWEPGKTG